MKQNWIRACEHYVLRVLSVVFSAVSAHAILWFYSSMDKVADSSDPFQPYVKWGLAIGFTALGYFLSRGLVHRMLNKERILVYMVIFALLEIVEFSANFAQAAVAVNSVDWLHLFSGPLHQVLQTMVYTVMPITPFFTIALAVIDMDMDRAKQGYAIRGFGQAASTALSSIQGKVTSPSVRPNVPAIPKQVPSYQPPQAYSGNGSPTVPFQQPMASYPPHPTAAPAAASSSAQGNSLANWWNSKVAGTVSAPPTMAASNGQGAPRP